MLKELREKVDIGFVGGSDLVKQQEQLKGKGKSYSDNLALEMFDYAFSENGLTAFHNGKPIFSGVNI